MVNGSDSFFYNQVAALQFFQKCKKSVVYVITQS